MCMYTYMHAYVYVYVCMHVYIYVYVCMHMCMYSIHMCTSNRNIFFERHLSPVNTPYGNPLKYMHTKSQAIA